MSGHVTDLIPCLVDGRMKRRVGGLWDKRMRGGLAVGVLYENGKVRYGKLSSKGGGRMNGPGRTVSLKASRRSGVGALNTGGALYLWTL